MTTLRDVAKKANVSQMTVSRVFNHPETVSDELKELVFSAVKELNYHPNASAKALKNKKTQVIKVLILENISSAEPYYMRVLAGITKKLDTLQYSLQLSSQFDLDIDTCDGLIVMVAKNTDHRKLAKLDKPLVLFGENPYFDFADTDNQKDIYQATIYAAHCGYEHLYYIGLDHLETFAKKRRSGYEQAISHLNKNSQIFTISGAHDDELDFLKCLPLKKNSAFICATDKIALEVSSILETKGVLPDDFGVIGHDGILLDKLFDHHLTTMAQNFELMGTYLAEMLLAKIYTKPLLNSRLFPADLLVRQTTRPLR